MLYLQCFPFFFAVIILCFALKCITKTPDEWLFNVCFPLKISNQEQNMFPLKSLLVFIRCMFSLRAVVIVDDEEEEEDEDEEEEADGPACDCDVDDESPPPWTFYADGDEDIDCDDDIDDQEDTALLRTSAANTEIVITPMSPVSRLRPPANEQLWNGSFPLCVSAGKFECRPGSFGRRERNRVEQEKQYFRFINTADERTDNGSAEARAVVVNAATATRWHVNIDDHVRWLRPRLMHINAGQYQKKRERIQFH